MVAVHCNERSVFDYFQEASTVHLVREILRRRRRRGRRSFYWRRGWPRKLVSIPLVLGSIEKVLKGLE